MFLSIFDVFKIGIGPSSSHTMGPMIAAGRFLDKLRESGCAVVRVRVSLHGSLAFTGQGHATDRAVILGLCGFRPDRFVEHEAQSALALVKEAKQILVRDLGALAFDPKSDLIFDYDKILPGHSNGMRLFGLDKDGLVGVEETYYSTGGGFVATAGELERQNADILSPPPVPYPFSSAQQMLEMAAKSGLTIAEMKRQNELQYHTRAALDRGIANLWQVMDACMERGLGRKGILPGGLKVRRRAKDIYETLLAERGKNMSAPHVINDWISVYAMAVNEENAAGGQVVTAPTNGAAGVLPAVLRYWLTYVPGARAEKIDIFLLTAAAIGGIIRENACISGAEGGCQAEVGSAAAMAAAGLCAVMGGTPEQIENAAEIALEHHLGMTCDPVGGLVQVPCIERNGLGAIKAVSAASLSLRGDGTHFIPLDSCIATMYQTGKDMDRRYKETSLGGLAVNIANC